MPYSPPAGNAANFTTTGYSPPSTVAARFPSGTYTPPAGGALAFVFPAGYVYPLGSAINFSVPAPEYVIGNCYVVVDVTAEGHGTFTSVLIVGNGAVTVEVSAEGHGKHGVRGSGNAPVEVSTEGHGKHGVRGNGYVTVDVSAEGHGIVERYELTGEVRAQGILVNRLVRAYRRDTGELVGEIATTAGRFKLHTGFVAREHFIVPIDTGNDATDWAPPCANRVMSVLAQDAA